MMRWWAPYQQYTFSTGNGGPGYGTTAQPAPDTAIAVGASTEFSATGWDSITSTAQINMNDVTPFSNKGPGANGRTGVDVVANGAYAPGDEALNYYAISMWGEPNGDYSWDSWGGTSRSSPVAAGVLALAYDAFHQATGEFMEGAMAKLILQSTATDLDYDVLTQGSGSVNGGAAALAAALRTGIVAGVPEGSSVTTEWQPGDYNGDDYPAFAHVIKAGESVSTTVMVADLSQHLSTTLASDVELTLIKQDEFDFTITPEMVAGEYANGAENRDNFYKAFQYMIPITAVPGMDEAWYNLDVPLDTDLMVVRALFPFDEFDADGDYTYDNRYYLMVYNWTDINGDGDVWDDKDGNGTVNIINRPQQVFDWDLIDGGMELEWSDARNELDRYEYARFSYHRPGANRIEMWVNNPIEQMRDGLFIGLRHLPTDRFTDATHLKFRVEYYSKQDCPWLELTSSGGPLGDGTVIVPFDEGMSGSFEVTAAPPADMRPGVYQAAIEIANPLPGLQPGAVDPEQIAVMYGSPVIVPVVMSVVQDVPAPGEAWEFGGVETYNDAYNAGRLYNNGAVRGQFDWTWREESGDWRFFFQDLPTTAPAAETNSYLIVRDQWADPAPMNDIDTVVLGPTETALGGGNDWFTSPEPDYFGPYTLQTVAQSPVVRSGRAVWMFNTSSGANEDWVGAPVGNGGLHEILQHHVLADGEEFDVVFTKTLGLMDVGPDELYTETCTNDGYLGQVTMSSSIGFNELMVETYGLSPVDSYEGLPIVFAGDDLEAVFTFQVQHGGKMSFVIDSADISDLDLYLFYLGPTGAETVEQRGSSAGPTAAERIDYVMPEDGVWAIAVDNYSGPAGTFDLDMLLIMGYDVEASGYPLGPVPPETPVVVQVHYSGAAYLGETGPMPFSTDLSTYKPDPSATGTLYYGMITMGPAESPALAVIDLQVLRMLCEPEPVDLQLSVRPESFCPGYNLEYTLVMTNTTSQTITDIVITDVLPALTSFVSASGSTGVSGAYNGATNTITWTKASLAPGQVLTAQCVLHSYSSMPDGYMLTNTFEYGKQQVSVTAMSDTDRCGVTPTPTATATATATETPEPTMTPTITETPQPGFMIYLPLLSRHVS